MALILVGESNTTFAVIFSARNKIRWYKICTGRTVFISWMEGLKLKTLYTKRRAYTKQRAIIAIIIIIVVTLLIAVAHGFHKF
jgi:uncharacterized membrane protein